VKYLFFIILSLLILSGCNNNNPQGRVAVRGEVIFDGKPLEQGDILFSSIAETTPKIVTGSPIRNGKFSMPAEHGLIPEQTYRVQFRSVEEIPGTKKETDFTSETRTPTRSILPRQYGVESKETVTATKKSPNVFKFELTTHVTHSL
jgi:hypothetical protein